VTASVKQVTQLINHVVVVAAAVVVVVDFSDDGDTVTHMLSNGIEKYFHICAGDHPTCSL